MKGAWAFEDRRVLPAVSRHRSGGDPGVDRLAGGCGRLPGRGPGPLPGPCPAQPCPGTGRRIPADRVHALRQHHPRRGAGLVPRRRVPGEADEALDPLERGGDGGQGQQSCRGYRWALVHVRIVGGAVRGRLQPFLPGQGGRAARRPCVHPGPCRSRHLRPGLPRAATRRGAPRQLPPRALTQGSVVLSAPPAHARLLGIPDRLHGSRADRLHLPGPLQPVPPQSGSR